MSEENTSRTGVAFPLALLSVGVAAVYLSGRISTSGLETTHDPGPRVFPMVLGMILIAGAFQQFFAFFWRAKKIPGPDLENPMVGKATSSAAVDSAPGGLKNLLLISGAFAGYLFLLPRLGFFAATWFMALFVMWRLGIRWRLAGFAAFVLLLGVYGLFVRLFKVPLPAGTWFG